jgi:hypothetical protein
MLLLGINLPHRARYLSEQAHGSATGQLYFQVRTLESTLLSVPGLSLPV